MFIDVLDANLMTDIGRVDEEAFFDEHVEFVVPDDLVLPTEIPTYSTRDVRSPEPAEALARAFGIDVPLIDRADAVTIQWEAFDSSTGDWLTTYVHLCP
jgi:hypothetical protein